MSKFEQFKLYLLKLSLKVLAMIFNRTEEINEKMNELEQMVKEGRVIDDEPFVFEIKINQDCLFYIGREPTKEELTAIKLRVSKVFMNSGYYPSSKQMQYFINNICDNLEDNAL